jgi:adenylate cyclase
LWADRFEGDRSDLFALQDEITSQIAFALNIELTVAEAARPTEHADAMDYLFRGRVLFQGSSPSRSNFAQAVRRFGAKPRKTFVDNQAASPSS